MVRQIFNEIIEQNEFTPEAWKKVKIKVIHKKGDVENVGNYRPICSLPALYKLFSTILCGRLYPVLDQKEAEDQAGFRKSYRTTERLAMCRMIEQKCHEWGIKMWTATIDFTKAFDSVTHKSIWKALKPCGIKHDYISLVKKIYRDQKASVQTDEESNIFEIKKGTKQGDPLSVLDSMEGGKTTGRTDELRYLPISSSVPGCLFWLLRFPGSRLPSLCCSESEDSIDGGLNSENSVQLRLCFLFFQPLALLIEIRRTAHCHVTVCWCKPCQQRKPHLLWQTSSRGYDPYTHACRARPLTTVGWTSLSVIVIVMYAV